jgi:hypothetical protein
MEIPVYLFTGFLDAGKTTFIQKTLEDTRFNQGESTLLLLCEDGEESYVPELFSGRRVFMETVAHPEDLTTDFLDRLCKKHACERVVVEYNGMWMLDSLYTALPAEWMVYQEFMFVDASSFFVYNANMRELVVDKLKSCEMVVFNRAADNLDKLEIHKMVRAINRRADIAYEDAHGGVIFDDIPDELPYDINAPVIELGLEDYATWYRDISEEMDKYSGKTISLSGCVVRRKDLPDNTFIIGRHIMTCCADDTAFAGVLCVYPSAKTLEDRAWVKVTAKIALRNHKIYGRKGPVFTVLSVKPDQEPENPVATFY